MDNEQQPPQTEQPTQSPVITSPSQPRSRRFKRLMLTLVMLLLAVGVGAAATYVLLHNKDDKDTQAKQSQGSNASQNSQQQAAIDNAAWHTVVYGNINRLPNIETKLAFPQNYQAIASDNGSDGIRSIFGDGIGSVTYYGGEWQIGNPENGDGSQWGNIEIMGIGKDWYSRNGYATYGGTNGDVITSDENNATINGYRFYTAQQKNASLKALISDTSKCAKDPAKGFSISGIFNVCYRPFMFRQAYASYYPQVMLSGYASIKGVPYVLFGGVDVRSGLDGYSDAQLNKAGDDFVAGKVPAPTQKNIDAFIAAFKHSTVATK